MKGCIARGNGDKGLGWGSLACACSGRTKSTPSHRDRVGHSGSQWKVFSREEYELRRIGSNIRKQNPDARANRVMKSIIRYDDVEKPCNEYPKKIVSPSRPSGCCHDGNREIIGGTREVDGFKFCYKICHKCGYALKFFFPAIEAASPAVKEYRQWKRYMAQ